MSSSIFSNISWQNCLNFFLMIHLDTSSFLYLLTSKTASVGWVNFPPINFEYPTTWHIDIGGLFDVDNVWGSGTRNAKIVGTVSTIETSLEDQKGESPSNYLECHLMSFIFDAFLLPNELMFF